MSRDYSTALVLYAAVVNDDVIVQRVRSFRMSVPPGNPVQMFLLIDM